MTPEQFEKIAAWMGWEKMPIGKVCGQAVRVFKKPNGTASCLNQDKLADSECIEALNRLAEKGYQYILAGGAPQVGHGIAVTVDHGTRIIAAATGQPTINQAIEAALLALVEKEGV